MARTLDLTPRATAPLFVALALLFAGAVATRWEEVAAHLPAATHAALLCATFPLLLLAGAIERRIDYGSGSSDMPLWMQISSRPVRWTFTLASTYLAIVVLQVLDIELGIVDPTPPAEWPPMQRRMWFFGFTFGMGFANYIAACAVVIPVLRLVTAPFSLLPALLGLPLLTVLGLGLGVAALAGLAQQDGVSAVRASLDALRDDPTLAAVLMVAAIVAPLVLQALLARTGSNRRRRRERSGNTASQS